MTNVKYDHENYSLELVLIFLPCVCVCVCERERETFSGQVFEHFPHYLIVDTSHFYCSHNCQACQNSCIMNEKFTFNTEINSSYVHIGVCVFWISEFLWCFYLDY